MNMIKRIFYTDLKNLSKSFFALVIVIGVCFLPALYAWCNIYSNWDPYGNTANLKMAAVSLDKGYADDDGVYHNAGDEIIEQLKENDKIDWQFVEDEDAAVKGVKDGSYYGAVVVSEDFSYNMYDIFGHEVTKPQLIFYQNQKKNPVATKISDTVVGTLQNNINEKFVKVMTTAIFKDANKLSADIEEDGGMDELIAKLTDINTQLKEYEKTLDALSVGNAIISRAVTVADDDVSQMGVNAKKGAAAIDDAQASIQKSVTAVDSYSTTVNAAMNNSINNLNSAKTALEEAKIANDAQAMADALNQTVNGLNDARTNLKNLSDSLNEIGTVGNQEDLGKIDDVISAIDGIEKIVSNARDELNSIDTEKAFEDNKQLLITYIDHAITALSGAQDVMNNTLTPMVKTSVETLEGALADLSEIDEYTDGVNATVNSTIDSLNDAKAALEAAKLATDAESMKASLDKAIDSLEKAKNNLQVLSDSLEAVGNIGDQDVLDQIKSVISTIDGLKDNVSSTREELEAFDAKNLYDDNKQIMITHIDNAISTVSAIQSSMNNTMIPKVKSSLDSLNTTLTNVSDLLNNVSSTLGGMGKVFDSLRLTIDSGSKSFEQTREAVEMLSDRLDDALDKVNEAKDSEKLQVLIDTLSGNPDLYGEFFAEPVQIETEVIYPVENYGSAVTPFYTVLAIWVGALILTAILKVKPNTETFSDAKDYELYLGRYGIFFFVGQIQTLIIVMGDLFLLHVQCIHPFYFWLASAMISFTFSLLIYTLVLAFGDVGKAFAVVIVVIQIAGSSGTYPIELLPEFFQKLYIFFPFPYGINALRECIAGMYEHAYVIYLLELMIFVMASLVLGLWIRKPFAELGHFMEKRMEDTEML